MVALLVAMSIAAGAAPPEALSPEIRAELSPGLVVRAGDAPVVEVFLRKSLPEEKPERTPLGVSFPSLSDGALVGAVRLADSWTDYKGDAVAAGVYTLRYAVQPADGNHMGVSTYRDFLILAPAAADRDPAALSDDAALYALGRKATGSNHPAVMSLVPVYDPPSGPASIEENDEGQPTLVVKAGSLTLGLVLRGQGEH